MDNPETLGTMDTRHRTKTSKTKTTTQKTTRTPPNGRCGLLDIIHCSLIKSSTKLSCNVSEDILKYCLRNIEKTTKGNEKSQINEERKPQWMIEKDKMTIVYIYCLTLHRKRNMEQHKLNCRK